LREKRSANTQQKKNDRGQRRKDKKRSWAGGGSHTHEEGIMRQERKKMWTKDGIESSCDMCDLGQE